LACSAKDVSANTDIALARTKIPAGLGTDSGVVAAGSVAQERRAATGRVLTASGVFPKRGNAGSRVVEADGVVSERIDAIGRVKEAGGVV
jgi:hypothetical protein